MAFNLIDSLKSLLGGDLVSKASSLFGENESNIQKGISAVIPTVLTGILNKAGSGDAHEVLKLSKEATDSGVFSGATSFLSNNHLLARGADFVKSLFGDRMSEVTNSIAGFSGMKTSSVSSLLSFAAPAALASLGREAEDRNMGTSDFLGLLNGQKENILNSVPTGFNLAGALGLSSLGSIGSRLAGEFSTLTGRAAAPQAAFATESVERKKSGSWVLPLILILGGLGLMLYLFRGKQQESTAVSSVADTSTNAAAHPIVPETPVRTSMESIKVKLPNGIELDAYKGGIEDRLVSFFNDPTKEVDKNTWFDFDQLNFETNSAVITPESMTQVQNIVAILKAFPNASIKIGGYTDKTGDEPANMKLSQARADAVVKAIKDNGVTNKQLTGAEGYGSKFATVPETASDEERRKDRRISVSPRKK